jgi:hypothetical protein
VWTVYQYEIGGAVLYQRWRWLGEAAECARLFLVCAANAPRSRQAGRSHYADPPTRRCVRNHMAGSYSSLRHPSVQRAVYRRFA